VIDVDADTTGVRADIVDATGNGLAELLVDEVMHIDVDRAALRLIIATRVLVFADQFFLLGVDRDHRLAGGLIRLGLRVDVLELRVPIGMASAFLALAVDLTAIAEAFEELGNPARRNAMPHAAQRRWTLHGNAPHNAAPSLSHLEASRAVLGLAAAARGADWDSKASELRESYLSDVPRIHGVIA